MIKKIYLQQHNNILLMTAVSALKYYFDEDRSNTTEVRLYSHPIYPTAHLLLS